MIELLRQLIAVPSFSRDEAAAADVLQAWMASRGLPVSRYGNNLWVAPDDCADGRPVILLNSHIDTVRPAAGYTRNPFAPDIEDGRLYGLGSNDAGGPLVALLGAYMQLASRPQSYKLVFAATAEEEVSGHGGIESLLPLLGRVDLGIVGEPTRMQMAVAEKGLMVLDCTARGRSGHAARNEGDNAIYRALSDIDWFRNHRFDRVSQFLGSVKMTVTQIEAGTQHNVVPDALWSTSGPTACIATSSSWPKSGGASTARSANAPRASTARPSPCRTPWCSRRSASASRPSGRPP